VKCYKNKLKCHKTFTWPIFAEQDEKRNLGLNLNIIIFSEKLN